MTYLTPNPGVSGASPGVVPLDFWSGLFLKRGETEGEWALEGRTWGNPPESLVDDWHLRATLAAKELDPAVETPKPLHPRATQHPARQVPDKKSRWRLRRQPR